MSGATPRSSAERRIEPRLASAAPNHYYRDSTYRPDAPPLLAQAQSRLEPAARMQPQHPHTPLRGDDEVALIRAVASGDRQAFERLYYLYTPRLARYLAKFLRSAHAIEEAIDDVMLVVWQSAVKFDPRASRLSTWLFGIAHNKALKAMARAGRHAAEISFDAADTADAGDESFAGDVFAQSAASSPERETLGKQFGALLAWALEQLSDEHRSVIELAFGEDCSYEEIARIAQCPVNTIKTRVFHARKKLAQLLASRGVDYTVDLRG